MLAEARYTYFKEKDIPKAQRLFLECLKHVGTRADAMMWLGQIADRQGHPAEALKYYDGLLIHNAHFSSSYATEIPVLGRYGELCDMQGRHTDALAAYQKILAYAKQFNDTAWADPNLVTDLSTNDPTRVRARAHLIMGIAHQSGDTLIYHDPSHKIDRALHAYREAVRLEPDLAIAHYYLGYGLQKAHREAEAKAEFARADKVASHDFRIAMHKTENDRKAAQAALEAKPRNIVHVTYTGPNTPPRVWSEPDTGQFHLKRIKR